MQTIFFIILTIFEICLTIFLVAKLSEFEKKVDEIHVIFLNKARETLIVNDKIKSIFIKTNKILEFITNKNLYKAISIIKTAIITFEVIYLLRSLNFKKKGGIFNFGNIKILFFSAFAKRFIKKILIASANMI